MALALTQGVLCTIYAKVLLVYHHIQSFSIFFLMFLFIYNCTLVCAEHSFPIAIFSQPVKEKPKDIFLLSKNSVRRGTTDKVPTETISLEDSSFENT